MNNHQNTIKHFNNLPIHLQNYILQHQSYGLVKSLMKFISNNPSDDVFKKGYLKTLKQKSINELRNKVIQQPPKNLNNMIEILYKLLHSKQHIISIFRGLNLGNDEKLHKLLSNRKEFDKFLSSDLELIFGPDPHENNMKRWQHYSIVYNKNYKQHEWLKNYIFNKRMVITDLKDDIKTKTNNYINNNYISHRKFNNASKDELLKLFKKLKNKERNILNNLNIRNDNVENIIGKEYKKIIENFTK